MTYAQTLVLDGALQPISRIAWQVAFTLWYKGRAKVLEYYDRVVKSAHEEWKVPSVIQIITGYLVTNKKRIRFSRENVYARDKGRCQYCGVDLLKNKKEYTWDHVIPQSRGGVTKWQNIVTCCLSCNQRKKNKTPEEANMRLLTKPVKPTSLPEIRNWLVDVPDSWMEYLYWTQELKRAT